ncbi:MAG: CRISPR-associated endonuclease Cas1 [Terrimicrobiaceae bacterium]|nr:CRISPR-associated endonuclease Cas1 [Terrimicrobiaceae bacterium]
MGTRGRSLAGSKRTRRSDDGTPDLFSQKLDAAVQAAFAKSNSEDPPAVEAKAPTGVPSTPQPARTFPPEILPARMLNEYVYCPRLFYYEHVDGIFVENADTVRGAALHKRVDSGSGALRPPDLDPEAPRKPDADPETIHATSVSMGSERLGVTAKLDLVESIPETSTDAPASTSVAVTPVDYKAGSPRENENGIELWPADRMQLGLQILILRDNGYSCDRGVIYYRGTKQRVLLEMTPELETWILAQVDAARRISEGPIPPPLVASPKCVRCSLNSVCLPDETRLLQKPDEPPVPPRRLLTASDETRVLYLNTAGYRVTQNDRRLVVKEEKTTVDEVRISDLTHVALFGNIQISTQAIQTLCENEVPITYFSMGGWFYGMTRGHGLKNVLSRIAQFRCAADPVVCREIARRFVNGKIRNQRTMLMRLHTEPPAPVVARLKYLAESSLRAESLEELLGIEGTAAATYFGEFNGLLKTDDGLDMGTGSIEPEFRFEFSGRNRRPPTDPVNALLSLAYSLLAKDCTLAVAAAGLDPYVGFYHQPRHGRPALALDIMEEFRPIVAESAVLTCLNNRMILPAHFVRAGKAVNLTPSGRKIFFQCYEQRLNSLITHPVFDYKVSYRRVLEIQARLLMRFLIGEISEYPVFVTR